MKKERKKKTEKIALQYLEAISGGRDGKLENANT